jgi:hypothetical protein
VLHVPLLLPLEQGLDVWRVIPLWAQKPKTLKRVETFTATHKAFLMLLFPAKHTSYTTPLCPLNPSCVAISVTCHTPSHSFYAPLPPHHVFISAPSTHHLCFTMLDLCNFLRPFYVFLKYVAVFIGLAGLPFTRRRVSVRWILSCTKMPSEKWSEQQW